MPLEIQQADVQDIKSLLTELVHSHVDIVTDVKLIKQQNETTKEIIDSTKEDIKSYQKKIEELQEWKNQHHQLDSVLDKNSEDIKELRVWKNKFIGGAKVAMAVWLVVGSVLGWCAKDIYSRIGRVEVICTEMSVLHAKELNP
jgi:hypothetical protein